jgi:hypothetical protein
MACARHVIGGVRSPMLRKTYFQRGTIRRQAELFEQDTGIFRLIRHALLNRVGTTG